MKNTDKHPYHGLVYKDPEGADLLWVRAVRDLGMDEANRLYPLPEDGENR